jgi:hypothetical protein
MSSAIRLSAAALGAFLLTLPALAGDVSGKWSAEFDTVVGVQKYTFDLKVDGDKLSGTAHFERMGQQGDAELKDGTVKGDEVSFVEMLDMQGDMVPITYKGTLAGDEIRFSRQVGDFGNEQFTAKRLKD